MLADRSYMRGSSFDSRRPVAVTLIIVLIVAFVLQALAEFYFGWTFARLLALSVQGIAHGYLWQLLTFQFLHSTPWPWHVLGNCLCLYFFGRALEEHVGPKRFLQLYFASGIAGGIVQVLTTWALPHHIDAPVVGASAGALGILAAYTSMFPEQDTMIFLYFFPLRIKAKYLFWFLFLLSLYGTFIPYGPVAYAAHLGGMLVGFTYVRWGRNSPDAWDIWRPFRRAQSQRELVRTASRKRLLWRRDSSKPVDDLPSDEFISREVDPILDKISAHGIQSLTERERKILEAARAKMSKR